MMLTKERSRSAVKKGPERSPAHLARVRAEPCIACVKLGRTQWDDTEAHHVRSGRLRTMGKRPSDYLAVPLCRWHHQDAPEALHKGSEDAFWERLGVNPRDWINEFFGRKDAA